MARCNDSSQSQYTLVNAADNVFQYCRLLVKLQYTNLCNSRKKCKTHVFCNTEQTNKQYFWRMLVTLFDFFNFIAIWNKIFSYINLSVLVYFELITL